MTKTRFLALVMAISVVLISIVTTLIPYARRPAMAITWTQTKFNALIRNPILEIRQSYSLLEFHWMHVTVSTITGTIRSTTLSLLWYSDRLTRRLLMHNIREIRNAMTGLALWLATVQVPFSPLKNALTYTSDDTNGLAARHSGMRRSPDSEMLSGTKPQLSQTNLIAAAA